MTTKNSKTAPMVISKRERAIQALDLRKAGISYEMIAQRLGYSNRTAAFRAVQTLLEKSEKEASTDLREMELRRLDDLFLSIYKKAREGDLPAIDRCLKIMERRAKMSGLDAPEKTQSDVRQIIKVVYEDVQYAEDFDNSAEQQGNVPALPINQEMYQQMLIRAMQQSHSGDENEEYDFDATSEDDGDIPLEGDEE